MVTLVGFDSRLSEEFCILSACDGSELFIHPRSATRLTNDFHELCSGMAAMGTHGAVQAGFRVVG